jgi:2-iminobutanoate/2-iminopropanoate deaminase
MMEKEVITTDHAPGAIGPYSQAIRVVDFVYTAGQGGLDPVTNQMVSGGVVAQAEQTMKNLEAVLEAAGTGFDNVIKTTIFLRYIKDFAAVNEVYGRFFGGTKPARSTVAVSALPLSALVEIEMVALVPKIEAEEQAPEDRPKKKKAKKKATPKVKGKKGKKGKR